MGFILEKDGVRDTVTSEIQMAAYVSNGWKVVEGSAEKVDFSIAMNEPVVETAVHEIERKKPGRKPKVAM